jgi:replicative DNA helicase
MTTGFPQLDVRIDGGIQNGQVVVILARTGVGKTLTLVNMFHRIIEDNPKKKVLFFSLEQTRNEWFDRALKVYSFFNPPSPKTLQELDRWKQIMSDIDMKGGYRYSLSRVCIPAMVDFYQDNFMVVDKNRVTEEDVRTCVDDFVEQMGSKPDLIAVDYLGYWARAFKGEAYERTTAAIMKLKEIGKDIQVPVIAPHQVNRSANDQRLDLTSSRDSGAVEETADFLFGLQRMAISKPDERGGGMHGVNSSELVIDILKSRHGGAGQSVTLFDAPLSLTMVERSHPRQPTALYQHQLHERNERLNDFYLRMASGIKDTRSDWKDIAFRKLEDELRK